MTQFELLSNFSKHGSALFDLKSGQYCLMVALLSYYHNETGECYPSRDSIENACGLGRKSQKDNQDVLVKKGLLYTKNKNMGDLNRHNEYVLNIKLITDTFNSFFEDEAIRKAAELNNSSADLFESPEEEIQMFDEEEQAFELIPDAESLLFDSQEAPEEPETIAITSSPIQSEAMQEKPAQEPQQPVPNIEELFFDDADELKRAVVNYAGMPNDIQKSAWNESLKTQGSITAIPYGKPKKRFSLKS